MTTTDASLRTGLVPRTPTTRAWAIFANGAGLPVLIGEPVTSLVIDGRANNGKEIMRLEYGAQCNPDGSVSEYDTLVLQNIGGAVTLPYAIRDDQLLVGVVEQFRHCEQDERFNPSGIIQNAPRGNHSVQREADQTARHELTSEVGPVKGDTERLPGANATVDNAWYRYQDELLDGEPVAQGGVVFYALQVNDEEMERGEDGRWRVTERVLGERPKGSPYEMIGKCTFVPWTEAVALRDGFTSIAVVRLLAHLSSKGVLKIGVAVT